MYTTITGRVARAGRSGTAYSFVSSDEVPYMIDLHLFLGRSLATSGKDGLYFIHVYMCIRILYSVHITRQLYTCTCTCICNNIPCTYMYMFTCTMYVIAHEFSCTHVHVNYMYLGI